MLTSGGPEQGVFWSGGTVPVDCGVHGYKSQLLVSLEPSWPSLSEVPRVPAGYCVFAGSCAALALGRLVSTACTCS